MGKVAAITGFGTGASAIAVGGNYLAGNFDSKPAAVEEKEPEQTDLPDTSEEAQEEGEGESKECWSDFFPGFDSNDWEVDASKKKQQEIDKYRNPGNKLETSFFTFAKETTPKSCLVVSWNKENYEDQKWQGLFHWLWAFVRGNQGFVWHATIRTTNNPSVPLELSGGIYFLKAQGDNWALHKYKEWKSTTTLPEKVTKQNFKDRFPAVGNAITKDESFGSDDNKKNHWGFVSGGDDLDKVCLSSDTKKCEKPSTPSEESFSWVWKWEPETEEGKSDDSHKITEWGSNSTKWLSEIYSESRTINTITSSLEQMKGKWIKETKTANAGAKAN